MLGHHVVSALSRARVTVVVVLFAVVCSVLGAGTASAKERSVTVMTQNLYQGTEFRHFAALQGKKEVTFNEAIEATSVAAADIISGNATTYDTVPLPPPQGNLPSCPANTAEPELMPTPRRRAADCNNYLSERCQFVLGCGFALGS